MDWNDVRYFLELSRAGSLSGASRAQRVEHTTVARRVAALEADLGVRLFDRLPRGWRLTEEGRALLPMAEALETGAQSLERRAVGAASAVGTVRMSAPPVLATHFVVPHLGALQAQRPGLCLELSADRRSANLLRGEAELALRVGPVDVPPGLIVREIGSVGYGLYGSRELLSQPIQRYAFAGFDDSMSGSAQKQWLDNYVGDRQFTLRSNDLTALHVAAKSGLGIALLPHIMVEPSDGLRWLSTKPFTRPMSLVLHPDLRRSPRVSSVVQFLTRLAQKRAKALLEPNPALAHAQRESGPAA